MKKFERAERTLLFKLQPTKSADKMIENESLNILESVVILGFIQNNKINIEMTYPPMLKCIYNSCSWQ